MSHFSFSVTDKRRRIYSMICLQQRTIYCLKVFMLKPVKNSIFEMGASSTAKNQCIYFLHKKELVIVTH